MTLEETIIQFKKNADSDREYLDMEWAEQNEQVAKWLEELKAIKEEAVFYSNRPIEDIVLEARTDAIEEFKERLLDLCDGGEECIDCVGGTCSKCFENSVDYSSIVDLAEELKEQK